METRELFLSACGVSKRRKCYEVVCEKSYKKQIHAPNGSFVYGLLDNDKFVYIGCTRNLRTRLIGHSGKMFQKVVYVEFTRRILALNAEERAIKKLVPELNKMHLQQIRQIEEGKKYFAEMEAMGFFIKWRRQSGHKCGSWVHKETGLTYHEHTKRLESSLKEETQTI